jgi:hypothetical protein
MMRIWQMTAMHGANALFIDTPEGCIIETMT